MAAQLYDYAIGGAGLFGSVFAREMADRGKTCLVIDRRGHLGGNCYTEKERGVTIHKYGPHFFHTDSRRIWDYVNRFADFELKTCRTKATFGGRVFSFPINLMTMNQLWGVTTPQEAAAKIREDCVSLSGPPSSFEEWCLANVGRTLYQTFLEGYTTKQWGRRPHELPASIIRRLPFRLTYDDNYFDHEFQGIPRGGYTQIFEKLLDHTLIEVRLNSDFLEDERILERISSQRVFTGCIDEYHGYKLGKLEYRSLRFETKWNEEEDRQGVAVMNYPDKEIPWTRQVEHKHFSGEKSNWTAVTREFSQEHTIGQVPYYPVPVQKNRELYERYAALPSETIFGGRLGTYRYYDMHQVIAEAIALAERLFPKQGSSSPREGY